MKNTMVRFFAVVGFLGTVFVFLTAFLIHRGFHNMFNPADVQLKKDAVLVLDLRGVIFDARKFLKDLRRYREDESIKGVIVRLDSPGGVVGPSQEIYQELKRVREDFKKPVIASVSGLAASGAYYSAVAADKIITNPGAILGSIGVIMEFANLEDLYSWAKIKRYTLKTGKFKDAGADYRSMTTEERDLLQGMIDQVLEQFVAAVAEGRKLSVAQVKAIADGRIITGEEAVKLGLADQIGTFSDAVKMAGEMTGLGADPELFVPPRERPSPFEFFMQFEEGEEGGEGRSSIQSVVDSVTRRRLLGKPLFILPGVAID